MRQKSLLKLTWSTIYGQNQKTFGKLLVLRKYLLKKKTFSIKGSPKHVLKNIPTK